MNKQVFLCGDVIVGGSGMVRTITNVTADMVEFKGGSLPISSLEKNIRTGICMWVSKDDDTGTVRQILNFMNTHFEEMNLWPTELNR